jgi:hypothetical protein
MNAADKLRMRVKELQKSINPTIQTTVNQNKPLLIYYQTGEQWYGKGEDSKGFDIVPSYALSTIKSKRNKGQKTSNVTLRDTGELYKSIKIDARTNEMIISANVEYFKYLVLHYGSNVLLGIQRSNLKKFVENEVLPNLKQEFKAIIAK